MIWARENKNKKKQKTKQSTQDITLKLTHTNTQAHTEQLHLKLAQLQDWPARARVLQAQQGHTHKHARLIFFHHQTKGAESFLSACLLGANKLAHREKKRRPPQNTSD